MSKSILRITEDSKFCGGCICEEHGKKKRPNPENTTEYVRVCDICDELHIQKTILGEFKEKLDKKLVALEKYEREIKEQQFKINEGQKELDELSLKVIGFSIDELTLLESKKRQELFRANEFLDK